MKNLSILRNDFQINQFELAEKIGVSQQTISKYENGTREPDHSTLIKLAKFFGVSVDLLLDVQSDEGIGYAIREEREKQGLSVRELANELNISVKELLQYETGDKDIDENIIDKIAKAFGMSWGEFLDKYNLYDECIYPHEDIDHKIAYDKAVYNDAMSEDLATIAAHKTDGYYDDLTDDERAAVDAYLALYRQQKIKEREKSQ